MPYIIDQDKCEKDDLCIEACPVACIDKSDDGSLTVRPDDCTDCGACEPVCPSGAIHPAE